ncbi:MAG: hypothetical protein ACKPFF_39960, partial [Planktothrix sp.]
MPTHTIYALEIMINPNFTERDRVSSSSSNRSPSLLMATLENLLTQIQADTTDVEAWSQHWHLQSFQLGDCIDRLPSSAETKVGIVYLVLEGRVRLLAEDKHLNREVSVSVVEPGETFGGDQAGWKYALLSYQAIAASDVIVASIPMVELQTQMKQIPPLQTYLQTTIENRQRLLFFKTQTNLRRFTSYRLQEILSNCTEHRISAGTALQKELT